VVDDKIERMLEFYKEQDEILIRKQQVGEAHMKKRLADKYFPTNGNDEDSEDDAIEEPNIIEDDGASADGESGF
jgi:hypothetical protein